MNVLIVDDNMENICLLQAMLEGAGYGVVSARNGKEALDRLRGGPFALIVSDILMPVMDGFQLCRECKKNPEWSAIPFIFYTATYTGKKDEEFALALGADRFVIKPQEPERFLNIVKEFLVLPQDGAGAGMKGPLPEEMAYLAKHNERMSRKLEKKVADLTRSNLALRESEEKYRLLADNVEDVIFVLDMNMNYAYISPSVKILRGYETEEVLGAPASRTLTPASWELAMQALTDAMALEETGRADLQRSRTLELEVLRRDGGTVWTEMRLSFLRDEKNRPTGILGVTRDITERRQSEEALATSFENLRQSLIGAVQMMARVVEVRDPYTAGHQKRVAHLARAVAQEMGLEGDRIEGLYMAAIIHDIGKVSVPAEILSKPSKLSENEFALIKIHPQAGHDMLQEIEFPWPIAEVILQHHERMDGSGYPQGLKGEDICLETRILAVADVVEAMASHRPYRAALGIDTALEEIEKNKGVLYDPGVVDACVRVFREKGYQFNPEGKD
ncbi:MAG: response regulator [Deltaproteobacteria bacterium]|nr:response regulator [Deltaproteobacteria bacterium]